MSLTNLQVVGCPGLIPVCGEWPNQILRVIQASGTVALDSSWVGQQTFEGQDWALHLPAS